MMFPVPMIFPTHFQQRCQVLLARVVQNAVAYEEDSNDRMLGSEYVPWQRVDRPNSTETAPVQDN
jgi:hypothetical protein